MKTVLLLSTVIIRWDVSMKTFIFPLSKQVVISVRECLRAQNSFLWNLIRSFENVLAACKHMLCLQDNNNCVVTLWKYLDVLEHTYEVHISSHPSPPITSASFCSFYMYFRREIMQCWICFYSLFWKKSIYEEMHTRQIGYCFTSIFQSYRTDKVN